MMLPLKYFATTLIANAVIGLLYLPICWRTRIMNVNAIVSFGAMHAVSSGITSLIQDPDSHRLFNYTWFPPCLLVPLPVIWTTVKFPPWLLNIVVLAGSEIGITQGVFEWYCYDHHLENSKGNPKKIIAVPENKPVISNTSEDDPPKPPSPKPPSPIPPSPKPPPSGDTSSNTDPWKVQYKETEISLVKLDFFKLPVDAVVNAANAKLQGGGGLDAVIHTAADKPNDGEKLKEYCRNHFPMIDSNGNRTKVGNAVVSPSFDIEKNINKKIKYIVHAVGPNCQNDEQNKNRKKLLRNAYYHTLVAANENDPPIRSIALPALSMGIFGYPVGEGVTVAFEAVKEYVDKYPGNFDAIYLAFTDGNIFKEGVKHFQLIFTDAKKVTDE
eukprot:GHVR01040387.1.p1 GENE.GHVR01040387.1~~GHVR01040387.1.p1  ORF type:complete len:384 (+),score=39.63 GHVR01040387.1:36-1187(+)